MGPYNKPYHFRLVLHHLLERLRHHVMILSLNFFLIFSYYSTLIVLNPKNLDSNFLLNASTANHLEMIPFDDYTTVFL